MLCKMVWGVVGGDDFCEDSESGVRMPLISVVGNQGQNVMHNGLGCPGGRYARVGGRGMGCCFSEVCSVRGFCGGLTGGFTGGVSCGSFQAGRHGYHAAEKVANATGNPLEKVLTQGYDDGHRFSVGGAPPTENLWPSS